MVQLIFITWAIINHWLSNSFPPGFYKDKAITTIVIFTSKLLRDLFDGICASNYFITEILTNHNHI